MECSNPGSVRLSLTLFLEMTVRNVPASVIQLLFAILMLDMDSVAKVADGQSYLKWYRRQGLGGTKSNKFRRLGDSRLRRHGTVPWREVILW